MKTKKLLISLKKELFYQNFQKKNLIKRLYFCKDFIKKIKNKKF